MYFWIRTPATAKVKPPRGERGLEMVRLNDCLDFALRVI